jgi:hypothetical protein
MDHTMQTTASENESRRAIRRRRYALDEIDRARFEEMMRRWLSPADSLATEQAPRPARRLTRTQ